MTTATAIIIAVLAFFLGVMVGIIGIVAAFVVVMLTEARSAFSWPFDDELDDIFDKLKKPPPPMH